MTSERAEAIAELLRRIDAVVSVGPVDWSESRFSYLDLAINYTLRRQREALGASLLLIDGGLGHLSVGFVRPALDEWLWLAFLGGLDPAKANELLEAMGRYDGRRSLKAQRDHVGDAVMAELSFPPGFVDAQVDALASDKDRLSQLGVELGWGKGKTPLPTARWLADQSDAVDEYEYLHAATSRALHFSAGEVVRNAWGPLRGHLNTDDLRFRQHLCEFALDNLWRLWFRTALVAYDRADSAQISGLEDLLGDGPNDLLESVGPLGQVPLVDASEWNLTPGGPLKRPSSRPRAR